MVRPTRWTVVAVVALAVGGAALCTAGADGFVFVDANGNRTLDAGESGVAGTVVSDGISVVRTDDAGWFSLPSNSKARFVFLSTPDGMRPTAGWYRAVAGGTYGFPLEACDSTGPLVFAQLSDIHYAPNADAFSRAFSDREMAFLPGPTLDGIVQEVNALRPDFVILTGDIIANAKGPELSEVAAWYDAAAAFATRFSIPVYGVLGNHDQVRDPAVDKSVYEEHFGPTYYSFNIKGTHIVVLDPHRLTETSQVYSVTAEEVEWLRQDLASADPNAPIIVFCHEPTPDWAATAENESLWNLLVDNRITALLNGHWHTNFVLREEPFYELTSGAVCGAWWEGPGPDGSEFGYRVYSMSRGQLDSTWRTVGKSVVSFDSPGAAALVWTDRLVASIWGRATSAAYSWDGGAKVPVRISANGMWSTAAANLNIAALIPGYHALSLEFTMSGGSTITGVKPFYVLVPGLSLSEFMSRPDVFAGKLVGTTVLDVRGGMGTEISATDGTKTIIVSKFAIPVVKGDDIVLVGMYRPTSADPIKLFDVVFSVKVSPK